jgi:hypothetical protein
MGMGGVENRNEFDISKTDLLRWLQSFKNKGEIQRRNAQFLETFLLTKVMPHEKRWFFAGRAHRLTLNEKSTSPLEGLNQVLKSGSGKTVMPLMSLLESMRLQDTQADTRMGESMVRACERARGRSLFSRSQTANEVTPLCETQLMQQKEQSQNYACQVQGPFRLYLKRLPGLSDSNYCEQCEVAGHLCPTHCENSPITTFTRVRQVEFIDIGEGKFTMRCSCLYQSTFGLPCRHQACVLNPIKPCHVIARHHTKFHAYYQKPGKEAVTEEFNRNKGEYRLIISKYEFEHCMDNAELLQRQQEDLLPSGYWQQIGPKRPSRDGLVRETTRDQNYSGGESFFEAGSFSQDICLHQPGKATAPSIEDVVPVIHQSCSLYESSMSYCKASVELIQRCNSPHMESFWTQSLSSTYGKLRAMAFDKFDNSAATAGEYVSISAPVDRRRKCVRIKSASEHPHNNKQNWKGERTQVQLSVSSFIATELDKR